jgi:DNA-binding NarL/FixJ family response regulator
MQVKPAGVPEAIDVAVVAPALALRAGLHALLSDMEGIEVVAEAAALAELDPFPPGVDILILAGGESAGEETGLVMNTDEVAILWLADELQQSARLFPESLSHARGILPLEATAEELHAAIRALAEGLWVGAPALIETLLGGPSKQVDPDTEPLIEPLTEREVEVLGWLAQGLANKQIAVRWASANTPSNSMSRRSTPSWALPAGQKPYGRVYTGDWLCYKDLNGSRRHFRSKASGISSKRKVAAISQPLFRDCPCLVLGLDI